MKDIILLQEKLTLVEQELKTVTDKIIRVEAGLKEIEDLKIEIKGLKVFLGRAYPEFKTQFPEIVGKIKD